MARFAVSCKLSPGRQERNLMAVKAATKPTSQAEPLRVLLVASCLGFRSSGLRVCRVSGFRV